MTPAEVPGEQPRGCLLAALKRQGKGSLPRFKGTRPAPLGHLTMPARAATPLTSAALAHAPSSVVGRASQAQIRTACRSPGVRTAAHGTAHVRPDDAVPHKRGCGRCFEALGGAEPRMIGAPRPPRRGAPTHRRCRHPHPGHGTILRGLWRQRHCPWEGVAIH